MRKFADVYLQNEPWGLVENGFHPQKALVSESLFALANEHMGVRGYFEEGYGGARLIGSYVNGVYEEKIVEKSYKGVSNRVCFQVNSVDWLFWGVEAAGERLDLASSVFEDFERRLDFLTGLSTRSFIWVTGSGKRLFVVWERILDRESVELGYQRLSVTSLDFSGELVLFPGLDFSPRHEAHGKNFWSAPGGSEIPDGACLGGSTRLGKKVFAAFHLRGPGRSSFVKREKFAGRRVVFGLEPGQGAVWEKKTAVLTPRRAMASDLELESLAISLLSDSRERTFDSVVAQNRRSWKSFWSKADVEIAGEEATQQGIRFGLFQLEQTFRGKLDGTNIGAKGLTGEAYNGNYFWDTEVYCFPFYLYTKPEAARRLLFFRYRTLPQAIERARELDCPGACFPVATIDGTESCTLWQHASLQLQPTTGVAYAIGHYHKATGDDEFLWEYGLEMLVQIARFLSARAQWSDKKKAWGYYAVMGPDEFQMMVNHNAYTNYMGMRSLEFALGAARRLKVHSPSRFENLRLRLGLEDSEFERWNEVAKGMYLPRDVSGLIEQHEGYFDLPHVDVRSIPTEEFPLYNHWSYDRIYRNDMLKQPDVLMFLFLYNRSFTVQEKKVNYEYYEPRCVHESSLSPSVHSILAAELGKEKEAVSFFRFAARVDLDDYNRNTAEGLHMTAIAASWMNVVYGFAGFRSDGDVPVFSPFLPPSWRSYSFRMILHGSTVRIGVDRDGAEFTLEEGAPLRLEVYAKLSLLEGRTRFERPKVDA